MVGIGYDLGTRPALSVKVIPMNQLTLSGGLSILYGHYKSFKNQQTTSRPTLIMPARASLRLLHTQRDVHHSRHRGALSARDDIDCRESDHGACGEVRGNRPCGTARPMNKVRRDDRSRRPTEYSCHLVPKRDP